MKGAYKKQRVVRDGWLFVVVVRSDVIGLVMEIYLRAVVYGIRKETGVVVALISVRTQVRTHYAMQPKRNV
jgi:hypothetical protein